MTCCIFFEYVTPFSVKFFMDISFNVDWLLERLMFFDF